MTMFLPKKFDKFTNYNGYSLGSKAHKIEPVRLYRAIACMQLNKAYKRPYIRFMWVNEATEAICVFYSDVKKAVLVTKLVPFSEVERLIMGDF